VVLALVRHAMMKRSGLLSKAKADQQRRPL
jgi:hypothetical protein